MLKFLRRFDFLPIVVLILFIVGTFVIWYVYNDYVLKKNYDLFDHETELIKLKIQQRLALYAQILESGRAFFEVSNDVQRSDWKTFVEAQNNPSLSFSFLFLLEIFIHHRVQLLSIDENDFQSPITPSK